MSGEATAASGPRAIRVGVTNAVLSNTGDAAIFESILVSLRAEFGEECEVVVYDSNARATKRLYPSWLVCQQLSVSPPREPARLRKLLQGVRHRIVRYLTRDAARARALRLPFVRRSEFARSFESFSRLDVVVSSGGTYLVDHYNFEARVVEISLARALGKPVVLWTQSMGPFESPRASAQIRAIAPAVDVVCFRDPRSERAWRSAIESTPASRVLPDSVFALKASSRPRRSGRRAFISVREWARGVDSAGFDVRNYEHAMRAAAEYLIERGWEVTALSTCQGVPSYAYDDAAEARRIFSGTSVVIDSSFHTPQQLLDELASADLVITTRMHLGILALISQVPVLAVAYEFKTLELFEGLGFAANVAAIERVSDVWFIDRIGGVLADPDATRLSGRQLADLRTRAQLPAVLLREQLG